MSKVLITGAAGFLGSHLCDRMLTEGYEVIGMDNLITGRMENIGHLENNPDFKFIHESNLDCMNTIWGNDISTPYPTLNSSAYSCALNAQGMIVVTVKSDIDYHITRI